jgi:ATP-dependent Lon protease
MDALDAKLTAVFAGKVVRKDLLHSIKKGTNVPTFVLEFLLARYCASDDEEEIRAGLEAVLATLKDNYVRSDEANAAQSRVATRGRHRFIDKVSVTYYENERKHWATLENFGSRRIAIPEHYYRSNQRLLEAGIWAEVIVAYNEIMDDDYAFYIEEMRPVQLSRFDFEGYVEGRQAFTRDEWLDTVLRSLGLEPARLTERQKLHTVARLAPLVEPNYNFIELGPRGTGKSYFFSEFSPYATLVSGGQTTTATLFYNLARRQVGLVGYWDTVAFDEVAGVRIKDPSAVQIMKDFMANGRFSRGVEVIADASMAFVGNLDLSVKQVVNSAQHDLFYPLPPELDLAVMDRFAFYLPGWEMQKTSSDYLTDNYGLITDYLAEAFHHQFTRVNRYQEVSDRVRLGASVEGRDEKGIKKTLAALLKILHPGQRPTDAEFEAYVAYAIEGRRRVKEQMNKRKPDDEFANIDLAYVNSAGVEMVVYCPESRHAAATQNPKRETLSESEPKKDGATEAQPALRRELPPVDLEALIAGHENERVEFKSSLQWDVRREEKATWLRDEVVATICAFLNTAGGTLLIGVSDEGEVLGLQPDLKLMNGKTPEKQKDNFALLINNLVNANLGVLFSRDVKLSFEEIAGKTIAVVRVRRGPEAAYVKDTEFYVRSGNQTRKLEIADAVRYIRRAW